MAFCTILYFWSCGHLIVLNIFHTLENTPHLFYSSLCVPFFFYEAYSLLSRAGSCFLLLFFFSSKKNPAPALASAKH